MVGEEKTLNGLAVRLRAKTIHELRQVAREVGVKCPAAGKKDRLVEDCLNIASGKIKPVPKKPEGGVIGAPPKSHEYDRQLVADILACRGESGVTAVTAAEEEDARLFTVSSKDAPLLDFTADGVLEKCGNMWFLRALGGADKDGVFVNEKLVKRFNLREGDIVSGRGVRQSADEIAGLATVASVNGDAPESALSRKSFDALTAAYPVKRLSIARGGNDIAGRMIDLLAPAGAGQRAFVTGAHGSGKTEFLKNTAHGIAYNNPEAYLIILLIDARPEEAADFARGFSGARIFVSTLENGESGHVRTARLALEHAKRQTEHGRDAVLILDDLTKLARAYNCCGGQVYSALDTFALDSAKKFIAAARNTEEEGSLTVIAALDTGRGDSVDEAIYSGLKNACNMRVALSGRLAHGAASIDLDETYSSGAARLLCAEEAKTSEKLRGGDCMNLFYSTASNEELCALLNEEN